MEAVLIGYSFKGYPSILLKTKSLGKEGVFLPPTKYPNFFLLLDLDKSSKQTYKLSLVSMFPSSFKLRG